MYLAIKKSKKPTTAQVKSSERVEVESVGNVEEDMATLEGSTL